MTDKTKASVDQYLETRQANTHPTDRGDAVVKTFKAPASWKADARSARFVMTSQAPDRMGDVIVTEGLDTTEFEKNPVGLLMHMSRMFPVGSWSGIEKIVTGRPPRMEGDLTLMKEGDDPVADQLAVHIARGTIRACSIGFMPRELELIRDKEDKWTGGFLISEAELYECSPVTIPAHPRALVKDAAGDDKLVRQYLERTIDEFVAELGELGVSRELFIEAMVKYAPPKTIVAFDGEKGFFARMKEAIGIGREPDTERVEPVLEPPAADPAVMDALVSKARASRDSLARKGLV